MSILKYERRTPKSLQKMYDYLVDPQKTDSNYVFGIGVNPRYAVTEMEYVQNLYRKNEIYHPYIQIIFAFDPGIILPPAYIRDICISIGYCLVSDERQVLGAIHYKDTDKVHCHYMINYVNINGVLYRQDYFIFHYYKKVNEVLKAYKLNTLPTYEDNINTKGEMRYVY